MFRMYGRVVQVLRYQISYTESEESCIYYAASQEEAQEFAELVNGAVSPLPESDDEWLDGIVVNDVPNTYGEAERLYKMGYTAYQAELDRPTDSEILNAFLGVVE